MYKGASRKAQSHAARPAVTEITERRPDVVDDDLRQNLSNRVKRIDAMIQAETDKEAKRALGLEKLDVQKQIQQLRKKQRAADVGQHFMNAAQETLAPGMFKIIMNKAAEAARKAQEALRLEQENKDG